jgi:hypothetical protein
MSISGRPWGALWVPMHRTNRTLAILEKLNINKKVQKFSALVLFLKEGKICTKTVRNVV